VATREDGRIKGRKEAYTRNDIGGGMGEYLNITKQREIKPGILRPFSLAMCAERLVILGPWAC